MEPMGENYRLYTYHEIKNSQLKLFYVLCQDNKYWRACYDDVCYWRSEDRAFIERYVQERNEAIFEADFRATHN